MKENKKMSLSLIQDELNVNEMVKIQGGSAERVAVIIGCGLLGGVAEAAAVALTWGLGAFIGLGTFASCMALSPNP